MCPCAIKVDGIKPLAIIEGLNADALHSAGEGDGAKERAILEGRRADACQLTVFAIGDRCEVLEVRATPEGPLADARHAIRNYEAPTQPAIREGIIADALHSARQGNGPKAIAILEGISANARTARDLDCFKRLGNIMAIRRRRGCTEDITKVRVTRSILACPYKRQGHGFEARATPEGRKADACHARGDSDRG